MRVVVVDRAGEVVDRVLEVVANPMDFHGYLIYPWIFNLFMEMVHAIGGYLPMRRVKYDHEEVPISMD